jgi:hypothetical protein
VRTRFASFLAAAVLACVGLAGAAWSAGTLPPGFHENIVIQGRTNPTSLRFGPAGEIFIAEKSGLVWFYDSFNDPSPTRVLDCAPRSTASGTAGCSASVDPQFPARPYLYVFAHTWPPGDPRFGDPTRPRWGARRSDDPCPSPRTDHRRLRDLRPAVAHHGESGDDDGHRIGDATGQLVPAVSVASAGDLVFGEDGYLYLSGGEGANFNSADWGRRAAR